MTAKRSKKTPSSSKKLSFWIPIFILPLVFGIAFMLKQQSTDIRSRASVAKHVCNMPSMEDSNLGQYAQERKFNVGTLLSECFSSNLPLNDQLTCQNVIKTQFNSMTLGYQTSWRSIEPKQGQYDWSVFDKGVQFARANNLKIHFFHLIWSNHERYVNPPSWVFPGKTDTSCGTRTKEDLEKIMKTHIQETIIRGGDIITTWNVVNEAFNEDGSLLQDCYYKIIGPDYIDKAFRYAREQSPHGMLVLNDNFPSASFSKKTNGVLSYVEAAKKRGVPIDAIGIQNHQLQNNGYQFSKKYLDDLTVLFKKALALDVKVIITEMDVYQAGRSQEQVAKVYKDTLALCLKYSNCTSLLVFGVSDKYSWVRIRESLPDAKPVLFDEEFQRKPPYYSVLEALLTNSTRPCVHEISITPALTTTKTPVPTTIIKAETAPSTNDTLRCYTYKDKTACEQGCGEKYGAGISHQCRWLKIKNSCVESLKPCQK